MTMDMKRLAIAITLAALPGCRFFLGSDNGTDASGNGDATVDAEIALCGWGAAGLAGGGICLPSLPTDSLTFNGVTIDTDINSDCGPYTGGGGAYCVIAAKDIHFGGRRIKGSKPLVAIVTSGEIVVQDTLDAAAHVSGTYAGQPAPSRSGDRMHYGQPAATAMRRRRWKLRRPRRGAADRRADAGNEQRNARRADRDDRAGQAARWLPRPGHPDDGPRRVSADTAVAPCI